MIHFHIAFVLDRSGSMESKRSDAIGGFNAYKAMQLNLDPEARFSLTLFDNEIIVVHDMLPIREVPDLGPETYVPRGTTALYDAIGRTIDRLQRAGDAAARSLIVTFTDGLENASHAYSRASLVPLIAAKKQAGWGFLYLGSELDAWTDALTLGMSANLYRDDGPGTLAAFAIASSSTALFRNCRDPGTLPTGAVADRIIDSNGGPTQ